MSCVRCSGLMPSSILTILNIGMDPSHTTALHRHRSPHRELLRRYRHYAAQQEFRVSVLLSVLTFAASLITVFYAIGYATESASNFVTDIVLSNTPVFDVYQFFVYGTAFFVLSGAALIAAHPKRIPFALHTIALFYFARAAFISLTHLGPFPLDTANSFDFGTILSRCFFGVFHHLRHFPCRCMALPERLRRLPRGRRPGATLSIADAEAVWDCNKLFTRTSSFPRSVILRLLMDY